MSTVIESAKPPALIGQRQLAERLGVSMRHLARMTKEGLLPRGNWLRRTLKFDPREIEGWLAAGSPPQREWEQLKATQPSHETAPAA